MTDVQVQYWRYRKYVVQYSVLVLYRYVLVPERLRLRTVAIATAYYRSRHTVLVPVQVQQRFGAYSTSTQYKDNQSILVQVQVLYKYQYSTDDVLIEQLLFGFCEVINETVRTGTVQGKKQYTCTVTLRCELLTKIVIINLPSTCPPRHPSALQMLST